MPDSRAIELDVAVFGGGIAGLWLLDALLAGGRSALLLETCALGSGQTIASQGIIHGGLKYTLDGLLNPSAEAIREMPAIWRQCIAGDRRPDLRGVRLRADHCYLWRTAAISGIVGMVGAQQGLRVRPVRLERHERPEALRDCPGAVYRLDEQVLDCVSLIETLRARHAEHILLFEPDALSFENPSTAAAGARVIRIVPARRETSTPTQASLTLRATTIVLAAGAGNEQLRGMLGLPADAMQRRPLHMVLARGPLPRLNGHCVDGARTRVTITSDTDSAGRTVWQIGGQLAEEGVNLAPGELVRRAAAELRSVLPGLSWDSVELATYRVDRAEARTRGLLRPEDVSLISEGNVITGWPTKLALAPRLAARVIELLPPPADGRPEFEQLADWPRPPVATPPWEEERAWFPAR